MRNEPMTPSRQDPDVVDLANLRARSAGAPGEQRHFDMWLSFDVQAEDDPDRPPKMRMRDGERLAGALQRVSLEQFDVAIEHLRDTTIDRDVAVHEARKAMKRIRAILRLVRTFIGDDIYRAENLVLRDASRKLSGARTAAVMGRALDHLIEQYAELQPQIFLHLRNALQQRNDEIADDLAIHPQLIDEVLEVLEPARARFAAWPTTDAAVAASSMITRQVIPDDFSSIEPGIRKVYRRGRARMADALAGPSDESFHEWRKRVKYLRYQMETLKVLWPDVIGGLETSLSDLAETLGEEHDLAELAVFSGEHPELCTDSERRLLGAIIAKQRTQLQQDAEALGERIYYEEPRAFTKRLEQYWHAWHGS